MWVVTEDGKKRVEKEGEKKINRNKEKNKMGEKYVVKLTGNSPRYIYGTKHKSKKPKNYKGKIHFNMPVITLK